MPKFTDIKILEYLETPSFRNDAFAEWMEREHTYAVSADPQIRAVEQTHFALVRARKERTPALTNVEDMESALLPILARMEHVGVYVAREELKIIGDELRTKSRALEGEMYAIAGEIFNPASAKQVQYILYEKMGISKGKKTKTGYSVDSEALELISEEYEIASLLLKYRSYEKLRGTYAEGLIKEIGGDGRIHTTYKQTATSTGRIASEAPNLQNIPSWGGYAGRIKGTFRPQEETKVFVVADYSQVELRILAMMSGDTALIEAFNNNEDIHARTAKFLFPNNLSISSEERRIAKAVNFWVIYGITGFGLSKMIGTNPKEASAYIDAFYARYPGVRAYYDALLENARKTGYVETWFGRRRMIKGLNDGNSMMRQAAEREAMNAPIQWTAADVIKLAMIALDKAIQEKLPSATLLMQVHDELVLEVDRRDAEDLATIVRGCMESVLPHDSIRLKVDIGIGDTWQSAKH